MNGSSPLASQTRSFRGFDEERRVKALFALICLIFPLQYYYAKAYVEPYPALIMPGFEGSRLNSSGQVSSEDADVRIRFRDGTDQTTTLAALFVNAPSSEFSTMAQIGLHPKPAIDPDKLWGTSPAGRFIKKRLIPGYVIGELRRYYWNGVSPSTVAWLKMRAGHMFPGRIAVGADIEWHNDVFQWQEGKMIRRRGPKSILRVTF